MKIFLIYFIIVIFGWIRFKDSPSSYESKLSSIAIDFRNKIMEEYDCKNLMYDASRVADDIDNELKKEDYSTAEILEFKELKRKAEALEKYIGTVGGCGNNFPTIEEFNIANRLVGGNVANVVQGKFCVDFISVSIDKYIVYIAENNTNNNYVVNYKYKTPNGTNIGRGFFGLFSKEIHHLYNNREEVTKKKIIIFGITCRLVEL